ncbi:hypothetical protein Pcinc_019373 [Petrolisthes cinctipes]|uniref:Uncharacterized protein n=1 Tax=Petrolisthes cinctipes TaxID=88211 RepID=A0AAE1FLB9_PETCI|nr:hypothetical protein Pcinc_019373 [Petrolisthes cinctipes]
MEQVGYIVHVNHVPCIKKLNNKIKKDNVHLYWVGYNGPPTHGCDPTTARHGCLWLLSFPPGPMHISFDNLDTLNSSRVSILMPELSADTHSTWEDPLQDSYPQAIQCLSFRVAGLQNCATSSS